MGMKKFGLEQYNIDRINHVFELYGQIDQVIIYGSRAIGNYRPGSDIDLSIKSIGLSFSDLKAVEVKIDDLMLPYKVDISLFHRITDVDLVEHINKVGMVFYEKKEVDHATEKE